jgi:regulatory protein
LAERQWDAIRERDKLKKKEILRLLLRKGFESDMIYEKAKQLELIS